MYINNDTLDLGFSLVFLAILTCNVKSKLFKHDRPKAHCLYYICTYNAIGKSPT